jgi:ribose transport system ATP-binding protein
MQTSSSKVSSDMADLISMSDCVIIMKNGQKVVELRGEDISEENILTYSIGHSDI